MMLLRVLESIRGRLNTMRRSCQHFYNTLYYNIKASEDDRIYVNCWVDMKAHRPVHRNWGDELNIYLLEALTTKHIIPLSSVYCKAHHNYTVIGSVVDTLANSSTTIWGGGAMYGGNYIMKYKPERVTAVRGRLTREYLLSQGVQCPEIYGDPALLLPYLYKSNGIKRYRLGIIPHVTDIRNNVLTGLQSKYPDAVTIINLQNYNDWHEIINRICECETVVSSSLHGLIVSDAYGIPNMWIEANVHIHGGKFKYLDYFSAVNRDTQNAVTITPDMTLEMITNEIISHYNPIIFDARPLIDACPFNIKLTL